MWYKRIVEGRDFLFFYDSEISIFLDCAEIESPFYEKYLAWVAEGNTAEEWSTDDAS